MLLDPSIIDILRCPVTRRRLKRLPGDQLDLLNQLISRGRIRYVNGTTVFPPMEDALITEDDQTIYRVDSGIPLLLVDKGIPAEQILSGPH